jgi:drug/metabolite transporter (DMT)-like permease
VAGLYLGAYLAVFGGEIPALSWRFLGFTLGGGVAQIIATNLLIMGFGFRGFAVGTAYSKTEVVQSAFLALLLLGEHMSALSWAGVGLSVFGVLYLSLAGREMTGRAILAGTFQPAALCGLAAGFGFGMASVLIKAANFALPTDDRILAAVLTLFLMNGMQTLLQGAWLAWREPEELRRVFATWRTSALVGTLSASGSTCWFIGFATAPVGLVRAVGQVEILFTLLFGRFYLRERTKPTDVVGALILVAGVVLVVVGR